MKRRVNPVKHLISKVIGVISAMIKARVLIIGRFIALMFGMKLKLRAFQSRLRNCEEISVLMVGY